MSSSAEDRTFGFRPKPGRPYAVEPFTVSSLDTVGKDYESYFELTVAVEANSIASCAGW